MIFDKFSEKYMEDAVKLAQADYDRERKFVNTLYEKDFKDKLTNCLVDLFKSNYGAVALDNGKLIGYLGYLGPWDGCFGNVKGVFSPMFANSFRGENRGRTASKLFQYTSEQMVRDGILSFAVCTYSHDSEVKDSFVMNGFGIRCSDAIRRVDTPLDITVNPDYSYEEINYSNTEYLLKLKNSLVRHTKSSPIFMPCAELSAEDFKQLCERRKSRFFIAKDGKEAIGFIEVTDDGETFISEEEDMLNICGAYLEENYRGKSVFQSLLKFTLESLKKDGINYLGVDCETLNPNALSFWGKYFESYTYSFHRRIDERIIL